MPFPTFVPPNVSISPGSNVAYEPRVRMASFGDGYKQRSGDGLNALGLKLEANFNVLTASEAEEILDFFAGQKGYLPFMWTMPGEASPRQWIATSWRRSYTGKDTSDIAASFEEVFDPAPA